MPNCPECQRTYTPGPEKGRCLRCDAVLPAIEAPPPAPRFRRETDTRQLHILLPPELYASLYALAEAEGWSVSAAIRECIKGELARRKEG